MNLWLIVLLFLVIAVFVFVSLAADKKGKKGKHERIKRDYRDTSTIKEAAKCLADGSVAIVKGIWLVGGYICVMIYDGWKTIFKKKKTGKTKQGKMIW